MAEPIRRLANLPGYDTAPDIYETPTAADSTDDAASTTLTQQTSPQSPSDTDETSDEEDEDEEGGVISRRRLFPERARSRFAGQAQGLEGKGVDLSERVDGGRKGYRLRRRRSWTEREEEGLEQRIARLRREIEECRADAGEGQAGAGAVEDEEDGVEGDDTVEGLSRLLAGVEIPTGRRQRTLPRTTSGGTPGASPLQEVDAGDDQALSRVAGFDTRLAALEQALGISALDSATSDAALSTPVLPSLTLLDQQLSALTSATSLANLEAASTRIQKLSNEADAVSQAAHAPPTTNGTHDEGSDPIEAPTPLSNEDIVKLQTLYTLIPTLQSLSPTVPALLTRLRSLRTLHTSAANAASELDDVEKRQAEMDKELTAWREGLERLEETVQEASEANGRNGKVVEGWLYDDIYTKVFTSNEKTIEIDRSWRPPAEMQVDRITRDLFAQSYFADDTSFEIRGEATLRAWRNSIQQSNLTPRGRVVFFRTTFTSEFDVGYYTGCECLEDVCVELAKWLWMEIGRTSLVPTGMRVGVIQKLVDQDHDVCVELCYEDRWVIRLN
ncbi:hypothetical protein LTR37_015704 [Vermiconidia calcicola]|uniref:Uncharacterized protein n=1 Tax=Vermiconidia calcicola TaxID=1690605 RepID=A0ACC3MQK7_9PEZI|nr:hypothetical protein LTR37_015704 [Vermiconidia calcicola]